MTAQTKRHLTFVAEVLEGVLAEFGSFASAPQRRRRAPRKPYTPRPIIHKTVIIKQEQRHGN